jgi:hypothetical protein
MNKLHYLATLFGIVMLGFVCLLIYSEKKDGHWVAFDQDIVDGSKVVTYADMNSVQIMSDGYIAFKLILNNETNKTSVVQTIFLGCEQKLYGIADYTNYSELNGFGKQTLYGQPTEILSIRPGSPMERYVSNICPMKS